MKTSQCSQDSQYAQDSSEITSTLGKLGLFTAEEWKQASATPGKPDINDVFGTFPTASQKSPSKPVTQVRSPSPTKRVKFAAYAIYYGRKIGVTDAWPTAEVLVNGIEKAQWKGFRTVLDACIDFKQRYNAGKIGRPGEGLPPLIWPTNIPFDGLTTIDSASGGASSVDSQFSTVFARAAEMKPSINELNPTPSPLAASNVVNSPIADSDNAVFAIVRGKFLGVFPDRAFVDVALGSSGKGVVMSFASEADADAAFVRAFMSSQLIAYHDDGTVRRVFGPFM